MKDNVLRLQIEVDDFLLALIEVLESAQNLRNNELGLLLWDHLVLLKIDVQIWPRAKLKDRAEAVVVYFHGVELFHDPPIVQVLVYLVFSDGMLDVIVFNLLGPAVVKVVDFASDLSASLKVKGLVHL